MATVEVEVGATRGAVATSAVGLDRPGFGA
jgi:hypothetical protein